MRLFIISEDDASRLASIINQLQVPEQHKQDVARIIFKADPSRNKMFVLWLTNLVNRKLIAIPGIVGAATAQLRIPEDTQRIIATLTAFVRAKPRLPPEARDITRYKDFWTLEDTINKIIQSGKAAATADVVRQVPGADIVYNKPPYTIYKINRLPRHMRGQPKVKLTTEEQLRVKAVEILGMGPPETSWCTRANYDSGPNSYAEEYLRRNDIFVIYKDGRPFIQKCSKQVMNTNDRATKIPEELLPYTNPVPVNITAAAKLKGINASATEVTMTNGMKIIARRVVDSGRNFLYIAIGGDQAPRLHTSGLTTALQTQARLGLSSIIKNPKQKIYTPGDKPPTFSDYPSYKEYQIATARYIITRHYAQLLTANLENIANVTPIQQQ